MALYRVLVYREQQAVFWVEADDEHAAGEDAEQLADGLSDKDWEMDNVDVSVIPTDYVPTTSDRIWTGGPDGDWRYGTRTK